MLRFQFKGIAGGVPGNKPACQVLDVRIACAHQVGCCRVGHVIAAAVEHDFSVLVLRKQVEVIQNLVEGKGEVRIREVALKGNVGIESTKESLRVSIIVFNVSTLMSL